MSGMCSSRKVAVATVAAAAMLAAGNAATTAAAPPASGTLRRSAPAGPTAVPGEIVIGFRSGVGASARADARADADVQVRRNLLTRGAQLVKVDPGQTRADAI